MMRTDSSWSVFPMAPSIIIASASSLTEMPVPPSVLYLVEPIETRAGEPRQTAMPPGSGSTPWAATLPRETSFLSERARPGAPGEVRAPGT
nr:hypothetical protein GCM10025730_22180 [Promicromonospora thailandica]